VKAWRAGKFVATVYFLLHAPYFLLQYFSRLPSYVSPSSFYSRPSYVSRPPAKHRGGRERSWLPNDAHLSRLTIYGLRLTIFVSSPPLLLTLPLHPRPYFSPSQIPSFSPPVTCFRFLLIKGCLHFPRSAPKANPGQRADPKPARAGRVQKRARNGRSGPAG
jgi:hypothetical protein